MLTTKDEGHLIHEKIAIPAQSGRVPRPRLLKLLENNLTSYNATIINGRAGTGKSVLAAGFARRAGRGPGTKSRLPTATCEYSANISLASIKLQRFWIDSDRLLELIDTGCGACGRNKCFVSWTKRNWRSRSMKRSLCSKLTGSTNSTPRRLVANQWSRRRHQGVCRHSRTRRKSGGRQSLVNQSFGIQMFSAGFSNLGGQFCLFRVLKKARWDLITVHAVSSNTLVLSFSKPRRPRLG